MRFKNSGLKKDLAVSITRSFMTWTAAYRNKQPDQTVKQPGGGTAYGKRRPTAKAVPCSEDRDEAHLVGNLLVLGAALQRVEDVLRAEVGGHDDDSVAEADRAALRVGDAAVVKNLAQVEAGSARQREAARGSERQREAARGRERRRGSSTGKLMAEDALTCLQCSAHDSGKQHPSRDVIFETAMQSTRQPAPKHARC